MKIDEAVKIIKATSTVYAKVECDNLLIFDHDRDSADWFMKVPTEASTWESIDVDLDYLIGVELRDLACVMDVVQQLLNTPVEKRFPEKKYRVRLIGFNSSNGKQYLTTENDNSNPLGHKFFACALRAGLKQEFTMDELSTIANKYEFKAVPWIQDLLRNIEPVEEKNDLL